MSTFAVELSGLDELDAALAAVSSVLTDPATALAGTQLLAAGARPYIPKDKGALAASERVTSSGTGARLVYAVPYSAIVSSRQPWLGAGISSAVDQLVELYERKALEVWGPA